MLLINYFQSVCQNCNDSRKKHFSHCISVKFQSVIVYNLVVTYKYVVRKPVLALLLLSLFVR